MSLAVVKEAGWVTRGVSRSRAARVGVCQHGYAECGGWRVEAAEVSLCLDVSGKGCRGRLPTSHRGDGMDVMGPRHNPNMFTAEIT
jgi:hypothetical protein